jgi:hypothetical protein
MKKIFLVFLLLTILLATSCIEIVEEITIHNDQSGNIKYKIKTNQIVSFFDKFSDIIDISLEKQLKTEAEKFAAKISGLQGIDSVKIKLDGKISNFSMGFSFCSADDLNNAIYKVFGYKQNMFSPKYLNVKEHKFNRINFSPWVKRYFEQEGINFPEEDILSMVNFKTIVYYPQKIKKYNGDNLVLSDNGKILSQKNSLIDLLENKTNVSIKSRY